jgi:FdhD protein
LEKLNRLSLGNSAQPTKLFDLSRRWGFRRKFEVGSDQSWHSIIIPLEVKKVKMTEFLQRKRHLTGLSGCDLNGVGSVEQAMQPVRAGSSGVSINRSEIFDGFAALKSRQELNQLTHAWPSTLRDFGFRSKARSCTRTLAVTVLSIRQFCARHGKDIAGQGRYAHDEQNLRRAHSEGGRSRHCHIGWNSVPTAGAVRLADAANMTLVGIARDDGFEVFTHSERVILD